MTNLWEKVRKNHKLVKTQWRTCEKESLTSDKKWQTCEKSDKKSPAIEKSDKLL